MVKLWQGDTTLVTLVMLGVGIVGGVSGCAYVAFKRTPSRLLDGTEVWQYPRGRRWALAGGVLLLLLAVGGGGYYVYEQAKPPTTVIVLVADFDGPDSQNYRVTETILEQLRDATHNYPDVAVKALAHHITVQQGSSYARQTGQHHKASIVIWGWYGKTQEKVLITVHFGVFCITPKKVYSTVQE